MRRLLFALPLLVLATCKGGLPLDEGNAYFCDPTASRDRNAQDAQCPPGWVCGVTGRCQKDELDVLPLDGTQVVFLDENAERVYPHPLLSGPYHNVAAIGFDAPEVLAISADGGALRVTGSSVAAESIGASGEVLDVAYSPSHAGAIVVSTVTGTAAPDVRRRLVLHRRSDNQTVTALFTPPIGPTVELTDAWALRAAIDRNDGGVVLYVQRQKTEQAVGDPNAGELELTATPTVRPFRVPHADGGFFLVPAVADARPVPRATFEKLPAGADFITPLALTNFGFHYRRVKGAGPDQDTWVDITAADEDVIPFAFGVDQDPPRLRTDATHSVFAVSFALPAIFVAGQTDENKRRHTAISTWRFQRTPTGGTAARTWGDCTPCGPRGYIGLIAPTIENGVPAVDVVCDVGTADGGFVSAVVRVTGTGGNDVKDSCAFSPFALKVDPREVAPTVVSMTRPKGDGTALTAVARQYAFADYLGGGLVIGGAHGQIWRGRSFDDLKPMYLDRVPDDVSTMSGRPFAIAANFSAKHSNAGLSIIEQRAYVTPNNEVILPRSAPSDPSTQSAGWVVLNGGELAKINPVGDDIDVRFGSSLVNSAGNAAAEPYFVEKVVYEAKTHFTIGAFDSLYSSSNEVTVQRGELPSLSPVVTPAPGAAIRSFVMDRSDKRVNSLTGEGKPMALGYLVAGGTLFRVTMTKPTGTAERWVADPIDVGGGEPIKVFMRADPDPQALGRVGMRDGRIFSLPSAIQLTTDLSAALDVNMQASANSARALSFASIAELPVMFSEDGLWSPIYRRGASTYGWTMHKLPAELTAGEPRDRSERLQAARLHVATEGNQQILYLFTDYGFVYKLATSPVTQ